MGKNVAVFVDVANIFYAAKAAGVDIDYVTLLKSATAGRDLVRAYAYTGLDPDNENQRNFHDFLRRSNYKVVSKDIRKYGDGKVKANLDIELVVDMMKTARNLDIAIVVSGDGDFAPAIRAVQEQGVRVEVISFRGNTSSDLIDVADQFTDIVQLARVEKGSRSGRRVAEDDADLSMTEVPDKLTEGTGLGRGGRGRGRGRTRDEEPVSASRGRGRGRVGVAATAVTPAAASATGLVALPGERLARVGGLTEADLAAAEVFTIDESSGDASSAGEQEPGTREGLSDDGEPRRRGRGGGGGGGRGRGRADELAEGVADEPSRAAQAPIAPERDVAEDHHEEIVPTRRAPKSTPFGSVWDSQLGTPTAPAAASLAPLGDDEDFDEPEIPEYLIAEQRRGANRGGGGRGARGGRSAYQSAMDRERYGRGGAVGGGGGGGGRGGSRGINRYPDVSSRSRPAGPAREERGYGRQDRESVPTPPRSSSEPWSDVPPELEALLRAQVAQKPAPGRPARVSDDRAPGSESGEQAAEPVVAAVPVEAAPAKPRGTRKPGTRAARGGEAAPSAPAESSEPVATEVLGTTDSDVAPKRRPGRPRKVAVTETGEAAGTEASGTEAGSTRATRATKAAPKPRAAAKPRSSRKVAGAADEPAATAGTPDVGAPGAPATAAPRRRTTRKVTPAEPA
ncbi:MAG: NYN domain-containing protein [Chloroflexota bacterium]